MSKPLENSDFITVTSLPKAEKVESVKPAEAKKESATTSDESFLLYVNGRKKQIAATNPSIPSVKFTAFENPTNQKMTNTP